MAFTTLGKYFQGNNEEEATLKGTIVAVVRGMGEHAVKLDEAAYRGLNRDLTRLLTMVGDKPNTQQLSTAASTAMEELTSYNGQVMQTVVQQRKDLKDIVGMMSDTIVSMTTNHGRAAQALQGLETELMAAAEQSDIQRLKQQLGVCLDQIRKEVNRQQKEVGPEVARLRAQLQARAQFQDPSGADPVTGLPGQDAARASVKEALGRGGKYYIAIAVVHRMGAINARFGWEVGDGVMRLVKSHVEKPLTQEGALFRWDGPVLVALIHREDPVDRVRAELRKSLEFRMEKIFQLGDRTALVPISTAWSVVPVTDPVEEVWQNVEKFIATQNPGEH